MAMRTVPVWVVMPLASSARMTSPTAVTRSWSDSVLGSSCFRNRCWLVWTRPPNVKLGPAKKLWSFSEKMPNWKTGIATVCMTRRIRTSALPVVFAVTSMVYGVIRPTRPW